MSLDLYVDLVGRGDFGRLDFSVEKVSRFLRCMLGFASFSCFPFFSSFLIYEVVCSGD